MTKKRWLFNSLLALILTFSLLAGSTRLRPGEEG